MVIATEAELEGMSESPSGSVLSIQYPWSQCHLVPAEAGSNLPEVKMKLRLWMNARDPGHKARGRIGVHIS